MHSTKYAEGSFQFSESVSLLTKPLAIALRARVMLLVALGVLIVWGADSLLVGETAAPKAVASSGVVALFIAAWYQLQGIVWSLVGPFIELARGEQIGFNLLRCLIRIAVWAAIGGAVARIAVLHLTRGENPDLWGSIRYAWQYKWNLLGGPAVMIAGLLVVALPLLVAKLLLQVSWLAPIVALLWIIVLAVALVATVYALGALVGWPIMINAVAADRSDSFDAVSRVYAYVYQKPLRLVAYLLVALPMLTLVAVASSLFVGTVIQVSESMASETTSTVAAEAVNWWSGVASSLVTVYLTSLFWTTSAGIYLLRRRDVDAVPTDEVFIDPSEFESSLTSLESAATEPQDTSSLEAA